MVWQPIFFTLASLSPSLPLSLSLSLSLPPSLSLDMSLYIDMYIYASPGKKSKQRRHGLIRTKQSPQTSSMRHGTLCFVVNNQFSGAVTRRRVIIDVLSGDGNYIPIQRHCMIQQSIANQALEPWWLSSGNWT